MWRNLHRGPISRLGKGDSDFPALIAAEVPGKQKRIRNLTIDAKQSKVGIGVVADHSAPLGTRHVRTNVDGGLTSAGDPDEVADSRGSFPGHAEADQVVTHRPQARGWAADNSLAVRDELQNLGDVQDARMGLGGDGDRHGDEESHRNEGTQPPHGLPMAAGRLKVVGAGLAR